MVTNGNGNESVVFTVHCAAGYNGSGSATANHCAIAGTGNIARRDQILLPATDQCELSKFVLLR